MTRLGSGILLVSILWFTGCASTPYTVADSSRDEGCHKRLAPAGSSDFARPIQANGDSIDYYGPCNGRSDAERIQQQKRFEQFRFEREYMDEG